MDNNSIIVFSGCILFLLVLGRFFIVPVKCLLKLILSIILALITIHIINFIGLGTGIHIGTNLYTGIIGGILGVPGILFLVMMCFA